MDGECCRPDTAVTGAAAGPKPRPTAWYAKQPWLVGSNYIPATAINELEMWQADTFDPQRSTKSSAGPKASG